MGITGLPVVQHQLEPFFIDRTEVTNQAYKDFVDAGGYTKPDYWKHAFRNNGAVLLFDEAMIRFVDTTGRPGPSTWEVGSYPSGLERHPVQGVSWFEAAAYAEFRERQLPTIYHWNRAALPRAEISEAFSAAVVPLANIGASSAGPAPVASYSGMGHSGAYDMAGNVREWCYNGTHGQRYILGGSWSDLIYMFTQEASLSPWNRDPSNGFRCMTLPQGASIPLSFTENLELEPIDYTNLDPISDEIFGIYKGMFAYDAAPLNDSVDEVREDSRGWTRQTISFDAVYQNERVVLHLYLPAEASSPVPVVVFLPGIDALQTRSYNTRYEAMFDFVVKSGTAVAFPTYSGHYERGNDRTLTRLGSENSAAGLYRELVQDLGRTVEYLESSTDVTTDGLAFWAHSLGGVFGPVMLAATDSFDVAIFTSCGVPAYSAWSLKPENRPETYLPRIAIPTLILNGRFDIIFPVNTGQEPFVRLLGTPDEHKRHVILQGGHVPLPRTPMVTEILAWLERYQKGTR